MSPFPARFSAKPLFGLINVITLTYALPYAQLQSSILDGGNLLLVHVVGPIYDLRDFGYGPVQRRRPNEGLMRHARQRLRALARRHVGEKRLWRCVVRSGTAPHQILKAAEEFRAELVIMPTRGLSHAPPTEVGSTAERVVRHAPCPVLVLPKQTPRKRRKKPRNRSGSQRGPIAGLRL